MYVEISLGTVITLKCKIIIQKKIWYDLFLFILLQWNLTHPDTSVPRLNVRKTEFPDK